WGRGRDSAGRPDRPDRAAARPGPPGRRHPVAAREPGARPGDGTSRQQGRGRALLPRAAGRRDARGVQECARAFSEDPTMKIARTFLPHIFVAAMMAPPGSAAAPLASALRTADIDGALGATGAARRSAWRRR